MDQAVPHIAFLDEAGVPEIPALSTGSVGAVFCIANVFMPMHYWRELQQIYDAVRNDFGISTTEELKWRNLLRGTGPTADLECDCGAFIESLVSRLDPEQFRAVGVSVFKDDVYKAKGYIREGQDIYNAAVLFALQRLQNEINDCFGEDAHCPCIVIADSRQRGGQDNRLRKFVDNAMGGTGGIWVNFEKSLVEGILFQVSHYSVGVQVADFLAGAIYQKDVRQDDRYYKLWKPVLRKSPSGAVSGYGYVRWRR
jgi:Protein of unknown function (DUF3800)